MLKALTTAEVVRRLRAVHEEAEMAKGRKLGVSKSIKPKRPSQGEKARKRMGLPPIPKGRHSPGALPGPQK